MRIAVIVAIVAASACGRGIDKSQPDPFIISNNETTNAMTTQSSNNTTSNNAVNNGSTGSNNATQMSTNNMTVPTTNNAIDPRVVAACENYCEVFVGRCVIADCRLGPNGEQDRADAYAACLGEGEPGLACTAIYATNPDFRAEVDSLADAACDDSNAIAMRCDLYSTSCGACPAPVLGTACTVDSDCDGGPLTPVCFEEQPDGAYPGGQCLAAGCEVPDGASEGQLYSGGATGCGQEGSCFVGPGLNTFCLATCTTNADCHRAVTGAADVGYACNIVGTTEIGGSLRPLGFCETACVSDADCPPASPVCGQNRACRQDCESDADCPSSLSCTGVSPTGANTCEL